MVFVDYSRMLFSSRVGINRVIKFYDSAYIPILLQIVVVAKFEKKVNNKLVNSSDWFPMLVAVLLVK